MIVANDVSDQTIGFNSNDNATTLLWKGGQLTLPVMNKLNVATRIIDLIARQSLV
jgi:phosphopantothenoylcysteine decarboxylase/phosphopantothenate--cysteine ligase